MQPDDLRRWAAPGAAGPRAERRAAGARGAGLPKNLLQPVRRVFGHGMRAWACGGAQDLALAGLTEFGARRRAKKEVAGLGLVSPPSLVQAGRRASGRDDFACVRRTVGLASWLRGSPCAAVVVRLARPIRAIRYDA
jgi:hypothetical protein